MRGSIRSGKSYSGNVREPGGGNGENRIRSGLPVFPSLAIVRTNQAERRYFAVCYCC